MTSCIRPKLIKSSTGLFQPSQTLPNAAFVVAGTWSSKAQQLPGRKANMSHARAQQQRKLAEFVQCTEYGC
jgi:hypothetical protein